MQLFYLIGSVAALAPVVPAMAAEQPAAESRYELPVQPLAESIRAVGLASGQSIVAPGPLVDGKIAPPLIGHYSPEAALGLLLSDSGLSFRRDGTRLVVFRPGHSSSAPESSIRDDEIVVTGSNIRGASPTSPLQLITRKDIEASGSLSVEQLMRKVPQNSYAGVNKEMFGTTRVGVDVTDQGAGLNLRGLGQRATLVQVNGRRLAPTSGGSFVDVSLIPLGAIERVEILTDGASAIYGSDAVGGVVNFILRDDLEGLETLGQFGSATSGDGDQFRLAQSAGHSWASGQAMISYEYRREDEILAADRDVTFGLEPDVFLLPREKRHSFFAVGRQDLASGVRLDISGSYALRKTNWTYYLTGSSLPVAGDAKAKAFNFGGEITFQLGSNWRGRLDANYSRSDIFQTQTQPGGLDLVNARDATNTLLEAGIRLNGELFELPGGTVKVALGTLLRREDYRDDYATSAVPQFFRKSDRKVRALFGELLVPVVSASNRVDGIERLQLTLAGRYEHYSRFGSTFDPKVGVLWSPLTGLRLRASYGTSFRAPLLSQASGVYNAILFPAQLLYLDPSQGQGVGLVLQGTNPDVGPETSRNWTLGGEFSPEFLPELSLRANYYSIRFDDRIARATSTIVVVGDPAFEPIVDRSPSIADVQSLLDRAAVRLDLSGPGFTNGNATANDVTVVLENRISNTAVTTTSGIDFGLDYRFVLGSNHFAIDLNASHILDFTDRLTKSSPPVTVLDTPYNALDWRVRAELRWARGGWSGSAAINYADGYHDNRGTFDNEVHSYGTVDVGLAYEFASDNRQSWLHGTRIAMFGENIFDQRPPTLVPDPGNATGLGYDPVNASIRGRMISMQLRKRW